MAAPDARAALGAAAGLIVGLVAELTPLPDGIAIASYVVGMIVGGRQPALDGLRALRERRLDVDLLMVVAALAAGALGQWRDAALLIVIFATSGALEAAATERTAEGVRALLVDAPEDAERIGPGGNEIVPCGALTPGDRVMIRPGGRVPADGVVLDGEAAVDESSLTGEPLPVRKVRGRPVLAGASVTEGALVVEVTTDPDQSVLARLTAAVEEAVEQRPPTQLVVERFEQRYSASVVAASVLLAVLGPRWFGWTGTEMVERTMTFLVVASPCAVVLATMPATLSALAVAARHRVLLRGGSVLERLADVDVAAFDKTGTLTLGAPTVTGVTLLQPTGNVDDLLVLAAAAEGRSEHPIGRAIVAEAARRSLEVPRPSDHVLVPSRGVEASVAGHRVRVGGAAMLGDHAELSETGTTVGVELDGFLLGRISLEDRVRQEAACTVACLGRAGVTETWLLTGDHATNATAMAAAAGITTAVHGLLPADKAHRVRDLRDRNQGVAYIGDGVNDAAALATATVGVSLGQGGTALAVDAADVVLMDDDLHRLPDMIDLARRTRRLVRTNLVFALAAIAALVALDLAGRLPLVLGVIGHESSSIAVALNGLRLLRWRPPSHPAEEIDDPHECPSRSRRARRGSPGRFGAPERVAMK